jgi:TonB family protein
MTSSTNPLFRAASQGDANSVKALLAEGVDINASSERGQTALILAAVGGHSDVVSLLLAAGADRQTKDSLGLTAQDWAGRRGFPEVAEILSGTGTPKRSRQARIEPSSPQEKVVTDPPVEELNVEFRKPKSEAAASSKETAQYGRSTLPGLAGAILRLRAGYGPAAEVRHQSTQNLHSTAVAHGREEVAPEQRSTSTPPANLSTEDVLALPSSSTPSATVTQRNRPNTADPLTLPVDDASEPKPIVESSSLLLSEDAPTIRLDDPTVPTLSNETASKPVADLTLPSQQSQVPVTTTKPAPEVSVTATVTQRNRPNTADPLTLPVDDESEPTAIVEPANRLFSKDAPTIRLDDPTLPTLADETASKPVDDVTLPSQQPQVPVTTTKPAPEVSVRTTGRVALTQAWLEPSESPNLSHIPVPAFTPVQPNNTTRLIVWGLVLVMLGISSFVAYRLSNYFFRTEKPQPNTVATGPETKQIVKLAPVIGGALIGAELIVPDAKYPTKAKPDEASGNVTVEVKVNQRGKVTSARALDGVQVLRAAAVRAAKQAAFSPEKLNNKGRAVLGTITYNFVGPTQTSTPPNATPSITPVPEPSPADVGDDSPIAGGPLEGAAVKLPKPEYPSNAKRKGSGERITIVVRVNRAGKVVSWRSLDGDSQLRKAALAAARKATFSPAKLPGNSEVVGTITYYFK